MLRVLINWYRVTLMGYCEESDSNTDRHTQGFVNTFNAIGIRTNINGKRISRGASL
jgi:hypothetical protein